MMPHAEVAADHDPGSADIGLLDRLRRAVRLHGRVVHRELLRSQDKITAHEGFNLILGVAIIKALLVAMIFMHLKWDWGKLYFLIVPTFVLAPMIVFALLARSRHLLEELLREVTMARWLQFVTLVLLAASALLAADMWRRSPSGTLDHFGKLGSFSFTGRDGKPVTDRDLSGRVTVFACFFTCCTETCPQLSGAVAKLQGDLADLANVRLVSLTVDPENDTPDRLNSYAQNFSADPNRWIFLTGPREQVEDFVINRLKQGLSESQQPGSKPGNKLGHSNKLTLVDRNGEVRAWFDGLTADGIKELESAVRQLHGER